MGKKVKIMEFFSALGRSLMMPIAALAVAGLLLGLTGAMAKPQVQNLFPFLKNDVILYVINTIKTVTGAIFNVIPLLFSISIALGLAKKDKEIAAFAGFIGYYTFLVSASKIMNSGFFDFSALRMANILGVNNTIEMGAFAGIMTGIIVAILHNKYYNIEFPIAIAYYGGKRFVAIAVMFVMAAIGQFIPFIWLPVSQAINSFGTVIGNAGHTGVFIFGFLERALIPTGLHHILNSIFRTTPVGGVYEGVEGCLNIFLQFFDKVDISVMRPYTSFLGQGKMPIMIFGLPAAALAIYKTTPSEKKNQVKALMIAGVATSIVSGITEPLEFSFMFAAPTLFLFHAVMGGISFGLMSLLGAGIGNIGGGIIDMIIYGVIQPGSRWWLIFILGPIFAVSYYFIFKIYLEKKNITVDVNSIDDEPAETVSNSNGTSPLIQKIIEGLGGYNNIVEVNNCISRLRVDIKDINKIDEALLKTTGSMGIVKSSNNHIQIIYGTKVENIANQVRIAMAK